MCQAMLHVQVLIMPVFTFKGIPAYALYYYVLLVVHVGVHMKLLILHPSYCSIVNYVFNPCESKFYVSPQMSDVKL